MANSDNASARKMYLCMVLMHGTDAWLAECQSLRIIRTHALNESKQCWYSGKNCARSRVIEYGVHYWHTSLNPFSLCRLSECHTTEITQDHQGYNETTLSLTHSFCRPLKLEERRIVDVSLLTQHPVNDEISRFRCLVHNRFLGTMQSKIIKLKERKMIRYMKM